MEIKEIVHVIIASIVLAFTLSFIYISSPDFTYQFFLAFFFMLIVFIFNIGTKKVVAYYLQSDVETKIWQFQRYGFYERSYFKKPIPIGILLPFFLSILSLGKIPWLASTQSEITASKSKVAKRHGIYRFSEITDSETGIIASAGILVILFLAIISYLVNLPELSKISILFAAFNMIPLGNLDGTKVFFGNRVVWAVLAVLCLIGVGYVLLLV